MTLVEMRTTAQAAKVAEATGGVHLPGKMPGEMSRRTDIGTDFERCRAKVESVSVLFKLYDKDGAGTLVEVPSGWGVTGAIFEVEWPSDPEQAALIRSHFGARRFAYNWALAQVRADMDAKANDPTPGSDGGMTRFRRSDRKTRPRGKASRGEARIKTPQGEAV